MPQHCLIAPTIELHLEENGRPEFKLFEATNRVDDYHAYFLLWLTLLLDEKLPGRASNQSRIYDLGTVARVGLAAETFQEQAGMVLAQAPAVLDRHGFDARPLAEMRERLEFCRLPANDLIARFQDRGSLTDV